MKKNTTLLSLITVIFLLGVAAGPLAAQEAEPEEQGAAAPPETAQIQSAGKRLFKALADGDMAVVGQNTAFKHIHQLTSNKLRMPATGPKLNTAFNGSVTVVRSDRKSAVIEAQIFVPESTDLPVAEVSRVRVFMVPEGGDWKASIADKKKAAADNDINGGWYHASFFTFCPNKGLIFVPNHFGREMQCRMVAQCKKF